MMRLLNVVTVAVMVLGMAPSAHADSVLVSGPLARAGVPFTCQIANAGQTDVRVDIDILDDDGNVDANGQPRTIVPGASDSQSVAANVGSTLLHCRFTLLKGSKNKVRALACAYSSVDFSGPCLSVAEAR